MGGKARTLSSLPPTMSPFANTPHLWLSGHLTRLAQADQAVKIQAVARGYLVRRRLEKEQTTPIRLQPPERPVTLADAMRQLGLGTWANALPTAIEALDDLELAKRRQDALWHAGIALRLSGRAELIPDLEWADYHERSSALRAREDVETPSVSLWDRFRRSILG